MLLLLTASASLSLAFQDVPPAAAPCQPQPPPPAIDSAGELPIGAETIEFAATPSLEFPRRAWVVRLSRRGTVDATIEIVRLRLQFDCNRYDVERRWRAPLRQEEYWDAAAKVAPLGVPSPSLFQRTTGIVGDDFVVVDGTSIALRLRAHQWMVQRDSNHYASDGARISAVFRDLVSRYVPAANLPSADWRMLSSAE